MGQISLPRLNRINTSMFWESYISYDHYHYNSVKLYIFYKYFIKYFFSYKLFNYGKLWGFFNWFYWNSNNITFFKKKIIKLDIVKVNLYESLKFYLYTFNSKYFLFFITINTHRVAKKTKNYSSVKAVFFKKLSVYV